jgi:hypothetical protein
MVCRVIKAESAALKKKKPSSREMSRAGTSNGRETEDLNADGVYGGSNDACDARDLLASASIFRCLLPDVWHQPPQHLESNLSV